jgi:hypothetical protein
MKNRLSTLLFFFIASVHGFSQDTSFVKHFRLSNSIRELGYAVMERSDGKIITGGMSSNCTGMTCENSTSISCFTAGGTVLWHYKYGISDNTVMYGVVEGENRSTIVIGTLNQDLLVYKVDENGSLVWSKTFGAPESEVVKKIVKVNGGYMVLGNSSLSSNYYGFLFKINESGTVLWYKKFAQSSDFESYGLTKISENEVLVSGCEDHISCLMKVSSDGNLIDSRQFTTTLGSAPYHNGQATVISKAPDGTFFGTLNIGSAFILYQLDANLSVVWSKTMSTTPLFAFNAPVSIIADPTNGFWLGSNNSSTSLPTWMHFSSTGTLIDSHKQTGVINGVIYDLAFANNGDLLLSGKTQISTQYNCFLSRISSNATLNCISDYPLNTAITTIGIQNYTASLSDVVVSSTSPALIADPGTYQDENLCLDIMNTSGLMETHSTIPVSVFPNPAHAAVQITAENTILDAALFSIDGVKQIEQTANNKTIQLSLSQIKPGTYLLVLNFGQSKEITKIVVD